MKLLSTQNNKGFTLIELLVVVAIIGLLSSVVLVSLSSARIKAENTAKNQLIRQYLTAFQLYYNDKGVYPLTPFMTGYGGVCLGKNNPDDVCFDSKNIDDSLNTLLNPYIPGPPASTHKIIVSGVDYSGIYYDCIPTNEDPTLCDYVYLEWAMEGTSNRAKLCFPGVVSSFSIPSNATLCRYPF